MICQTSRTGTIVERHREDHTDAPNEAAAGHDPRCQKRPSDQARIFYWWYTSQRKQAYNETEMEDAYAQLPTNPLNSYA